MSRDLAVPLAGDLRPLWRIEGRIYNNSIQVVATVKLRITMNEKQYGIAVDSDDINLKPNIPPGGVRGFAQTVHLLPPVKGEAFEWNYEVIQAEREP